MNTSLQNKFTIKQSTTYIPIVKATECENPDTKYENYSQCLEIIKLLLLLKLFLNKLFIKIYETFVFVHQH